MNHIWVKFSFWIIILTLSSSFALAKRGPSSLKVSSVSGSSFTIADGKEVVLKVSCFGAYRDVAAKQVRGLFWRFADKVLNFEMKVYENQTLILIKPPGSTDKPSEIVIPAASKCAILLNRLNE